MDIIVQILAAFIGTMAFSVVFYVPVRQYAVCGAVGAIGWCFYLIGLNYSGTIALFLATIVIALLARSLAVWRKVPSNVFMISGIFPIVPGVGIYNTIYHMMVGELELGVTVGLETLKGVGAIVLGMIVVFSIPNKVFAKIGVVHEKIRKK